jgi:peptidoglycan hydrolase-like protein with peptidoglycan-binding domain
MGGTRLGAVRRLGRGTAAFAVASALLCVAPVDTASAAVVSDGSSATVLPKTPVGATPPVATPVTAPTPRLRSGSRGEAVRQLQRRLAELGYDVGKVNGVFGDDTLHGVRAFQKVQGQSVTGVVTSTTWARLADPVAPRARYVRAVDAVEVDLTRRVLFLTRGGTVTAIFDVSPGKPSTPTVTGRFTIYRRVDRWDQGPLGGLYRPNYFHHGFALHGSLSVPTYSASHGCVRLTTRGMDRLWPKIAPGESVTVYRT